MRKKRLPLEAIALCEGQQLARRLGYKICGFAAPIKGGNAEAFGLRANAAAPTKKKKEMAAG